MVFQIEISGIVKFSDVSIIWRDSVRSYTCLGETGKQKKNNILNINTQIQNGSGTFSLVCDILFQDSNPETIHMRVCFMLPAIRFNGSYLVNGRWLFDILNIIGCMQHFT